MLDVERLVLKVVAVDADGAGAVAVQHVASLDHELPDDAMERGARVGPAADALRGERHEVPHGPGRHLAEQPEHDPAGVLAADADVEEHLVRHSHLRRVCERHAQRERAQDPRHPGRAGALRWSRRGDASQRTARAGGKHPAHRAAYLTGLRGRVLATVTGSRRAQ